MLKSNNGAQTSLHYHTKEKETQYVFEGVLNDVLLNGTIKRISAEESITFNPCDAHRLEAIGDVTIFEETATINIYSIRTHVCIV